LQEVTVRRIPFGAVLLSAGGLFFPVLAEAQIRDSARVPMKEVGHFETVQIWLNGNGPYDFILDTGTNSTLVRRQLLERLRVPLTGRVGFNGTTSHGFRRKLILDNVSLGGLNVERMEAETLEPNDFKDLGNVMGVLGENFLRQFDLLIDNVQQALTLDRAQMLAKQVIGEHLHLVQFGSFHGLWTPNRLVVELRMPAMHPEPLQFLVDSGVSEAMLFNHAGPVRPITLGRSGTLQGMNGDRACFAEHTRVELGGTVLKGVNVVECPGLSRKQADTDGLIPTRVFRRVFLTYRGAYMIVNPSVREEPVPAWMEIALRD
jgi:hypothetical protein